MNKQFLTFTVAGAIFMVSPTRQKQFYNLLKQ